MNVTVVLYGWFFITFLCQQSVVSPSICLLWPASINVEYLLTIIMLLGDYIFQIKYIDIYLFTTL